MFTWFCTKSVLEKVKSGVPKNKILEDTGHIVGIYDVSFEVYEGEFIPPLNWKTSLTPNLKFFYFIFMCFSSRRCHY